MAHTRYGDQIAVFNILSMILSGLFVGLFARFFYPGAVPMGIGHTIVLGIGGSLLAGLAASLRDGSPLYNRSGRDGFSRAGCIASVLGAMLLIFIGRHFIG